MPRRNSWGAFCAVVALLMMLTPHAAGDVWDGNGNVPPSSGWLFGPAWDDNTTPGNSDTATFNLAAAYTVSFIANPAAIQALTVSNGDVTFASDGSADRTLSVTSASGTRDVLITGASTFFTLGASPSNDVNLIVGDELSVQNDASLTAQFGVITAARFSSFGLNGSILIDGLQAFLALTDAGANNFIGRSGNTGYLILNNGTILNDIAGHLGIADSLVANSSGFVHIVGASDLSLDGNLTLANRNVAGQVASLDIHDPGSSFFQTGASSITVGSATNGTAAINIGVSGNSGTLTTGSGLFTVNTTGTVTIGSTGNVGRLNANGNVVINGGTLLRRGGGDFNLAAGRSMTIQNGGLFDVAGSYEADSTYIVTGAGSSWINSSNLSIGSVGTGSLTISAGGAVANASGNVGLAGLGDGEVTVTGVGSSWTNSGGVFVGLDGTGQLTIQNGGEVSNTSGSIGSMAGSNGTVTVTGAGSTWTNASQLLVGNEGTGSLMVSAGGAVSNDRAFVGYDSNGEGTVTVTGAGSTWGIGGSMYVGGSDDFSSFGGTGTLTIELGGAVSSSGVNNYVGANPGSEGHVTVTGAGSTWTIDSDLRIGYDGDGTVLIANGGAISNMGGYIGTRSGAHGAVTVTGTGSTWANSSGLAIGFGTTGTLTIEAGGAVSNTDGYIGFHQSEPPFPGGAGHVIVTGPGSTWDNDGELQVGRGGVGKLTIKQGGAVTSTVANAAVEAGSVGTVTVTDVGSTWTTSGLNVGGNLTDPGGDGEVNVRDGGLVEVNGDTIVWNDGTINLQAGGTVDAQGAIDLRGGAFNFLGGTLHVDGFLDDLLNQGGILAPGHSAGATTIDGDYTQLAAATLQIELGGTAAGTEFDTIRVGGDADLAGTLEVLLIDSFVPVSSDSFQIITSGEIIGTFATELLPAIGGGLFFDIAYSQNKVLLFVDGVLGDYNYNGIVDTADYVVWRKTLRQGGPGLAADGDGNGQVDLGDLAVWRAHFGESLGGGSGGRQSHVPEPTAFAIAFLGAFFWAAIHIRSGSSRNDR